MKKYKVILFDLDGTLTDPKEGITKSVQYALQKTGTIEADETRLDAFIGPPLQASFSDIYKYNKEQTELAIAYYRERFTEKGMYENKIYDHIPQLLHKLKEKGYTLAVATSKPTVFSKEIVNYFSISEYFDIVVGSNLDGTRTAKTEIIEYLLQHYKEYEPKDFIMIGDRKHDIIGANNNAIDSIAVTYGYGTLEELKNENPTYIVKTVKALDELF